MFIVDKIYGKIAYLSKYKQWKYFTHTYIEAFYNAFFIFEKI